MEVLYLEIIVFLLGTLILGFGFFLKKVSAKVEKLDESLDHHKLEDIKNFSLKEDCKHDMAKIEQIIHDSLNPINDKLTSMEEHLRVVVPRRRSDEHY